MSFPSPSAPALIEAAPNPVVTVLIPVVIALAPVEATTTMIVTVDMGMITVAVRFR